MSLSGTYDPNNIFARMLRGEMHCHKVFEDDVAIAIMDAFPQARGHTLVIPKAPARNLFDLPEDTYLPYMERVRLVARGVRAGLKPDGMRIMQFNAASGGQTVFHLHFHIVPAYNTSLTRPHASAMRADEAELAETAGLVRDGMAQVLAG
jgi:histidine triad (HIT) family protein